MPDELHMKKIVYLIDPNDTLGLYRFILFSSHTLNVNSHTLPKGLEL